MPADAAKLIELASNLPADITGFWLPSERDLADVDDRVEKFVRQRWAARRPTEKRDLDWTHYYRQVAGIELKDRRMLFLSYAWAPHLDDPKAQIEARREVEAAGKRFDPDWWKTKPIVVSDGGWAFFRVIYDIPGRRVIWYEQNFPYE